MLLRIKARNRALDRATYLAVFLGFRRHLESVCVTVTVITVFFEGYQILRFFLVILYILLIIKYIYNIIRSI